MWPPAGVQYSIVEWTVILLFPGVVARLRIAAASSSAAGASMRGFAPRFVCLSGCCCPAFKIYMWSGWDAAIAAGMLQSRLGRDGERLSRALQRDTEREGERRAVLGMLRAVDRRLISWLVLA
eukprot:jgi/Ulvmu1/9713/UM055_0051.1